MPWSTGTFSRVHDWANDAAAVIDIEAARMDAEDDNFETGINNCLTKDGQNTPTADLPMGGNKHTGVAEGSARTHYAAIAQLQDGDLYLVGSTAGTNTVTGSLTPAITAYTNGMRVVFFPAVTNTGATTLNLNSVAARAIVKNTSTALSGGELIAGVPAVVIYDLANTRWVLQNPQPVIGSFTGTLTGMTASTTGTVTYVVSGRHVTLHVASQIAGTSNTNAMTMTGLPAGIIPSLNNRFVTDVRDNGVNFNLGTVNVNAAGTIAFAIGNPASPTGFTTSGSKGLSASWSVTYAP